jgi:hypothetical protein
MALSVAYGNGGGVSASGGSETPTSENWRRCFSMAAKAGV